MGTHSTPDRQLPLPARAALALERDPSLDTGVDTMTRLTAALGDTALGSALRGTWMGHALHPALTDVPVGMWTAASVLDMVGGPDSRPAARRLLGIGLLAAAPTAASGWAEWRGAERPAQRVGLAHAALNVMAIGLYAGSWAARRRERHGLGAALAVVGAGAVSASAYLGGHLTAVRDVASRHPAFEVGAGTPAGVAGSPDSTPVKDTTGDDVVAAIAAQHARIAMMLRRVGSSSPASRADAFRQLLGYLAGHEAVEQELIHSLVPVLNGHDQGLERSREEEGISNQILVLEQLEPGSAAFDRQFGLFADAVSRHAKSEELDELPYLASRLSGQDAARIVEALAAHEVRASSRSGGFAAMVDAARTEVRAVATQG